MSSLTRRNKSYDYENNEKHRQKPKKSSRCLRRECRSHLNQNLASENFIYDLSDIFFKPMGTANTNIR